MKHCFSKEKFYLFFHKLTGCLHVICSLATYDLYSSNNIDLSMYRRIWYHFLVNLQPSLNIDNLETGYWPVVQNGVFDVDGKILEVDSNVNGYFLRPGHN